eukprot:CAMPEP_0182460312 /NCGR_PEP_ID=MMETSP1319-20130603/5211_1 /TAXON_ID=172717 /ORGANISM="Bolidomonas pacifica, Strain RCC208" /LENGTH=664 /DNA_ID=CAMNT_0024659389 /DNA_START=180 /DNA_END=2174 /DNA_ORIENTATION=-
MNLGIQHSRSPSDAPTNGGGIPREVIAMAKQMGMDMSELGPQAEKMWADLNDMSTRDPEEYDAFIKQQMEDAIDPPAGPRSFRPEKGFVVKAWFGSGGVKVTNSAGVDLVGKVFVNITSHDGIQRPLDTQNQPVQEDRPSLDNLQIPLVVSELRQCADNSASQAAAVDVVFNPWCLRRAEPGSVFRGQIVDLALHWVQQEQGCKLGREWKVIKSKYKGGTGPKNDEVVPFPVDESMLSEEDREKIKQEEEERKKRIEARSKEPEALGRAELLNNLKKVREEDAEPEGTMGGLNIGGGLGEISITGKIGSTSKKPLIQEVGGGEKKHLIEEVDEGSAKPAAVKKGKPLTKKMKGFLNKKSTKDDGLGLYKDGGSSGDGMGGKGGSYSRFMSKCKVVDTSQMGEEEQRKMMTQHASGSGAAPPKPPPAKAQAPAPAPAPAPPSNFDSLKKNKGFLNGDGKGKLYGKDGSSEGSGGAGTFDAEFAKLMEAADPEFNAQFRDPRSKKGGDIDDPERDLMTAALSSLANVGSLSAEGSAIDLEEVTRKNEENVRRKQQEKKERRMKQAAALEPDDAAKSREKAASLAYSTKEDASTNSITVTVDLSSAASSSAKLSMSDMDLEVSETTLRLVSKHGSAFVDLVAPIDCDSVKAKLSQKKKTLKVILAKK